MAVGLRLQRHGQTKRPFYRIVAADRQSRRDGRFLEIVGTLDPMVEPPKVELKEDRVTYWIEQGAKPTQRVRDIIVQKIPGLIEKKEEHQRKKIQERRRARKARLKKKAAN